MTSASLSNHGYRFLPEIIGHAVWLYHGFDLSFRDTEDLLAQRGVTVTYETIRRWGRTFVTPYARLIGRISDPSTCRPSRKHNARSQRRAVEPRHTAHPPFHALPFHALPYLSDQAVLWISFCPPNCAS